MMQKKTSARTAVIALAGLAAIALAFSGTAAAQPQEPPPPAQPMPPEAQPPEAPPAEPDPQQQLRSTLGLIHAVNQIEVQIALLAMNQADSDRVRQFASRLAAEHGELDRDLLSLANDLDIEIAGSQEVLVHLQQIQVGLQAEIETLVQAEGQEFDRAFLDIVVSSHETAIADLRQAREQVTERRARQLVDRSLRAFQTHLTEARKLQQQMPSPREPVG
jgi:putative membrane protein